LKCGKQQQIKTVWAIPAKLRREGSMWLLLHREQIFPEGCDNPAFLCPGYFLSSGPIALEFN